MKGKGDRATHGSNVASRNNTRSTNKGSTDVRDDGAVKIGHDHDVELTRLRDKLHGSMRALLGQGTSKENVTTYVLSTIISLCSIPEDL